jgi:thymidylate synthase (FAD)
LLITGSVRAFREMLLFHKDCAIVKATCSLLNEQHPYFFQDILAGKGLASIPGIAVYKVPAIEIDQSLQELAKHRHIAVKFVVNRAVTHEIVRHRPCGFLQESQRYCRYSEDKFGNEVTFIRPLFFAQESEEYAVWKQTMLDAEQQYLNLLQTAAPQAARTVLPNSCKTEIIVYANLEQWRHIFKLRCAKAAEPSMREVMIPLHEAFQNRFPAAFG